MQLAVILRSALLAAFSRASPNLLTGFKEEGKETGKEWIRQGAIMGDDEGVEDEKEGDRCSPIPTIQPCTGGALSASPNLSLELTLQLSFSATSCIIL